MSLSLVSVFLLTLLTDVLDIVRRPLCSLRGHSDFIVKRVGPLGFLFLLFATAACANQTIDAKTTRLTAQYYYENYSSEAMKRECENLCIANAVFPPTKDFPTLIFFHGGALKTGDRQAVEYFEQRGFAVISPTYRKYPTTSTNEILKDTAQAVAWSIKQATKHGGNPDKIAIAGHSAGGYIALQLIMDPSFLEEKGVDLKQIAAIVPYSAHTITHMTVREEQGIGQMQPTIDHFAPLFHVRPDTPPILLITGDRELELLGRYEENAYFWRMMKVSGHKDISLIELGGYGHDMIYPAHPVAYRFLAERFNLLESP